MNDHPEYRCPHCGAVSHSLADVQHQYCGRCHRYADDETARAAHLEAEEAGE